ncbi:sulfurtransferase [Enterobacteriaceae bacterium RIT691]|nr:sulfurtransferase [Enterobacteriaceae bacterium RIT691]
MKRVSQLTALALLIGLSSSATYAADMTKPLTFSQLQQQKGVAIDTRLSAFYNGWPQTLNGHEGHEPSALNLSASWLSAMSDEQLSAWLKDHQLTSATPVALYGSAQDNDAVAGRLKKAGMTQVSVLSDALQQPERLQKMAHFEQLVYPQWLHDLQQKKAVTAAPAGDWKVIEAAWGAPKLYLLSHIPGAGYIDTNEVESEPLWNKVSDDKLKALMAKQGIRHDTTVILYGRDVYAAARVAQILLYAGVKDVRLLDGGWKTWSDAGLPVERGTPGNVTPAPDFGAPIPGQPQLMLNTEQARALLHRQDASLVSIRSWPEFIGTTSGYSYIKPKGEIAGARWGHAGSDSTHMEDFHNPDGTMRSADDIAAMWKQWHILPSQQVAFYCGTGWRASETFMYARAMGWQNVAVYDGGWYEWSQNAKNPVQRGERGPDQER